MNRIANVLARQLGMVPGNRVLLRAPNTPMMVAAYLAVIRPAASRSRPCRCCAPESSPPSSTRHASASRCAILDCWPISSDIAARGDIRIVAMGGG